MSRISFFSRFENMEQILLDNARDLNETMETVSSGKTVRVPSDDPTAMVNIKRFSDQLDDLKQFEENINTGQTSLKNAESVMQKVTDVLHRTRELAVQGNNETLDQDARSNIADEVNQRLEQLVNLANSKIGGKYVFAGAETTTEQKPFEVKRNGQGEIVDVVYRGDTTRLEKQLGQEQRVSSNLLGSEVFQATNQGIEGGFNFQSRAELTKNLQDTLGFRKLENPPAAQSVTNVPPNDANKTTLQVSDASQFTAGEKVRVFDRDDAGTENDFEKTVITAVNPGANTVEVDLRNEYESSENPVIETTGPGDTRQTIGNPGSFGGSANGDTPVTLEINDASNIQAGDKIKIQDPTTDSSEIRVVQSVSAGGAAPDQLEVDLATPVNNYTAGNTTVQKVAEPSRPQGEGFFKIDDEKFYYDTSEDSVVDIARRINARGIRVEAKFVGDRSVQQQTLKNNEGPSPSSPVTVEIEDASRFQAGETVVFEEGGTRETATVEDVTTSGGQHSITVDSLANGYTGGVATVREENATGERVEYSPDEVLKAADGPYRLKLESRVPHEIYLKDFDRQPDNTPDQVEGLLSDLKFLGDGSGSPPPPRSEQDFPNPYHDESTITGKSSFDSLIDLRESLQPFDDADSGPIRKNSLGVGGSAQTRRRLDPNPRASLQQSLSDLSNALDNVVVNQSKAGARLNRMESALSRIQDFQLNTNELLSELQDANLAEVISDFQRQKTIQQASLRMSAQIMNMTLANFL